MVARETGVGGDEQVTEVDRVADATGAGTHGVDKPFHLSDGVGYEHCQKIVASLHAVHYAGGDGVDIFQHGGIFDALHVARRDGAGCLSCKFLAETLGIENVVASDCQETRPSEGDFLGMAWA